MERRNALKDNTIDLGRTDEKVVASEVSEVARLLLREFSHRINNEFASAIGVISVAARSANDEAKVALAAVQDQLQTYALVHHAGACRLRRRGRISPTTLPGNQPFKT